MDTPKAPEKIPASVLAEINTKLGEIETLAAPYLRSLDEAQRRTLAKMGEDSVQFVEDARDAAEAKPDVMPRRFELEPFTTAFEANRQLAPLVPRFEALARGLDDAEMWAGSVAYTDALEVYTQFAQEVGKDSTLKPYYDAMAQRFAKLRGKRTPKS